MAGEAAEAAETASYESGVLDTETRLAEEVAGVCRDYCTEVWAEAFNQARVPATSELRSAENIFFPEDIREVPAMLPPLAVLTPPPPEQLPSIQASSPNAEVPIGVGKSKEKGGSSTRG